MKFPHVTLYAATVNLNSKDYNLIFCEYGVQCFRPLHALDERISNLKFN